MLCPANLLGYLYPIRLAQAGAFGFQRSSPRLQGVRVFDRYFGCLAGRFPPRLM